MLLRDVLATASDVETATAALRRHTGLTGYHVLLAAPGEKAPHAAVIVLGDTIETHQPGEDGLLLGSDPRSPSTSDAARLRYGRVETLLAEERIVGRTEIQRVLADATCTDLPMSGISNEETRFSAVFDPGARTVYVALPASDGSMGNAASWALPKGETP